MGVESVPVPGQLSHADTLVVSSLSFPYRVLLSALESRKDGSYKIQRRYSTNVTYKILVVQHLRGSDERKKKFNIYVSEKRSKQNICIMRF